MPLAVVEVLTRRAEAKGLSLGAYLRSKLTEYAGVEKA